MCVVHIYEYMYIMRRQRKHSQIFKLSYSFHCSFVFRLISIIHLLQLYFSHCISILSSALSFRWYASKYSNRHEIKKYIYIETNKKKKKNEKYFDFEFKCEVERCIPYYGNSATHNFSEKELFESKFFQRKYIFIRKTKLSKYTIILWIEIGILFFFRWTMNNFNPDNKM